MDEVWFHHRSNKELDFHKNRHRYRTEIYLFNLLYEVFGCVFQLT